MPACPPEKVQVLATSIAAKIGEGDVKAAIEIIRSNTIIEPDDLLLAEENSQSALLAAISEYGLAEGYKLIAVEDLAQVLFKYSYIIKLERACMRLTFAIYASDSHVVVVNYRLTRNYSPTRCW